MAKRSKYKSGLLSGGCQHNLAGVPPLPVKAALPIACDASNARTVAVKACLPLVRVVARKPLHLLCGMVFFARLLLLEKCHGVPSVWLGAKRTYPICPILRRRCLASLSLSKSKTRSSQQTAERGTLLVAISNLE